jgi:hypothetical protein
MATVIDALVMTLGLDASEFDKNRKLSGESLSKFQKQADAVAKDVAAGGKKMAQGFSLVKTELLGMLAVFGASVGIKDFIASNVQGQAELGRLSKNLGISAQSLEAWGLVAQEMGGQATDAFGALQAVAGGLAEAAIKGHSALTDMARANGVALTDAKGDVLSYEDALVSISKRMAELPRQQAMYLANQLGVGSMFNELELGPNELKKRLDAARGLTRVTDASTASAARLQKQWADITQRFKESSEIAFAKLSPVLERLAERFANWLDSVDWDKVANQIETMVGKVNEAVKSFGGWKNVALVLGGILALKVLSPVISLVSGLTSMIALLAPAASGFAAMGVAATAAGVGVLALTAAAVAHVDALGGSKRGDGSTEDERPRHAGGAPGTDAASLWAKVRGQPSSYLGSKEQAELLLGIRQPGSGSVLARGLRNNNPGNLNFAGQSGAHLEGGKGARFAKFDTMQDGIAALARQLLLYKARGIDTIRSIVSKYAPAKDGNNESAYITDLIRATGKGMDEHLNLDDSAQLARLIQGISKHEGNGTLSTEQIMGGVRLGAAQRMAGRNPAIASRSSTAETHIGKIEVHTAATDAKGIVRDMRGALSNNALVASADTGLD